MAIPEFTLLKTTAPIGMYEVLGGTTIQQIGADLDAASNEAALADDIQHSNRTANYRGFTWAAYMHAPGNISISRYDPSTGTYLPKVQTAITGTAPLGMFVINTGTASRLVLLLAQGSQVRLGYTDDGTSWTYTGDLGGNITANEGPVAVFGEKLYFPCRAGGVRIMEVDPIAVSASQISPPFVGSPSQQKAVVDFCIHKDRLLCVAFTNTPGFGNGDWALYEFTGAGFSHLVSMTSGTPVDVTQAHYCQPLLERLPSDDTKLIAICPGTTGGTANTGTQFFVLTESGATFTSARDLAGEIAALIPGARGNSSNFAQDRILGSVFNTTDPTVRELYLFVAPGPRGTGSYSVYRYTGEGVPPTLLGTGFSVADFAPPSRRRGGGIGISLGATTRIVEPEGGEPSDGAWRFKFRGYRTGLTNYGFFYGLGQDTPLQRATISAVGGAGATLVNNTVQFTCDNGVTEFYVDLDIDGDGVLPGDKLTVLFAPVAP